ncbi:TraR/DksA family transcriptional regulator [Salinispira pacifica]
MTEQFTEARKRDLLEARDGLRQTLEMNTEEFNQLFNELSAKDSVEIADEQRAHRTAGRKELIGRERLRRIAAALHRINEGSYGICESCGGEIGTERLEAVPDAPLCIECQTRADAAAQ